LLIGQKCNDLEKLGFNDSNMLIFEKENFNDQVVQYRSNPESYLNIRENGKKLVLENHLISHRINKIKEIFNL
jgi:spore maturation protein CgeB